MTPAARDTGNFWLATLTLSASMLGMLALRQAAPRVYNTTWGRFPAQIVAVMRGRELLDNPGVNGYYERLLAKSGRMDKNYIYDNSFRVFRFRPNLTWDKNMVTTNSFGMVGPERTLAKPPHTRRIALLGSSLSVGHMVPADQIYATLLENKLNADLSKATGEHFEILNFACIAYTLPQMLDVALEDAPRFAPDAYLIDLNEVDVFRQWDRQLVQVVQDGIDPKYDFLRSILRQAGVSRTDTSLVLYGKLAPYRMQVLRWTLEQLKAAAARQHTTVVAVMLPAIEAGGLSRRRVGWSREIVEPLGIPVVDALDSFDSYLNPSSLATYPGDPHFNANGHILVADDIYRKLRAQPEAWMALTGTARP